MTAYIKRAACAGAISTSVPKFDQSRPHALRKLVERRDSPRVLAAPAGYGKSALAAQYASTMFSFRKTYWFSCTSPCFLRDLDGGDFLKFINDYTTGTALCVFDDLVNLNAQRVQLFKGLISKLQEQGTEVLITVCPEARNDFLRDENTLVLDARDLLIGEAEISMYRGAFSVPNPGARSFNERVPCIYLGNNPHLLFSSLKTHGLSKEKLLLFFLLHVLGKGAFSDLQKFADFDIKGDITALSFDYPHLGINLEDKTFACLAVDFSILKKELSFCIPSILDASSLATQKDFLLEIATHFLMIDATKAIEFVKAFCSINLRNEWILENASMLIDLHVQGRALTCLAVSAQQLGETRNKVYALCAALEFNLGHYTGFLNYFRLICNSHSSTLTEVLLAKIYYVRVADPPDKFEAISSLLETYSRVAKNSADAEGAAGFSVDELKFLSDYLFVASENLANAVIFLLNEISNVERGSSHANSALFLSCKWLIEDIRANCDLNCGYEKVLTSAFAAHAFDEKSHDALKAFTMFLVEELKALKDCAPRDFYLMQALMELYSFCVDFQANELGRIIDKCSAEILKANSAHLADKSDYEKASSRANISTRVQMTSGTKVVSKNDLLEFSFFGTPTCRVGDKYLDSDLLHRKNCLLILFFVFYNKGIEISRDELFEQIWGESQLSDATKKRSFYTATGKIKRELNNAGIDVFKKGSSGYYINPIYCKSDLEAFNSLCLDLTFNLANTPSWQDFYVSDISRFSKPLIPQIRDCRELNDIRGDFAARLTNALIAAANSMFSRGDFSACLWFANEAKHMNRGREDIYMLIMKAQNALSQRNDAVSTYFECRDFMVEEFGLVPTQKIRDLYDEIISS